MRKQMSRGNVILMLTFILCFMVCSLVFAETPLSTKDLNKLAADLGSDVPFFLNGPLALCTGRGEKIKKLDQNFNFLALLILPDISVSTERVYAKYTHNHALYKYLKQLMAN